MSDKKRIAAVDIGFGDVKVVGPNRALSKFSSIITPVDDGLNTGGDGAGIYQFSFGMQQGTKKYRLGGDPSRAISLLDFEAMRAFAPLLAFRALEAFGDVDVLALGLPLKYWKEYAPEFAAALKTLNANGRQITAKEVLVIPQAVGALMDLRFDWDGRAFGRKPIGKGLLVDVGFNTIDLLVVDAGVVVPELCEMVSRGGLSKVALDIARHIDHRFEVRTTAQTAMEVLLSKKMQYQGAEVDLADVCHKLLSRYAEELFAKIVDGHTTLVNLADRIILCGGGAHFLRGYIPEQYRNIVLIPDSPEYCNARGFYKRAVRG